MNRFFYIGLILILTLLFIFFLRRTSTKWQKEYNVHFAEYESTQKQHYSLMEEREEILERQAQLISQIQECTQPTNSTNSAND